jgi:glycosyltransferase involved in cell wall biosynthesis
VRLAVDQLSISVILPTYNRNDVICDAIDSVLLQTVQILEVIVIDDGSQDETEATINAKYKNSNVIYLKQRNAGPSSARNLGINKAKGNWLAFIDSDDMWEPDKLERQVNYLANHTDCMLVAAGHFHCMKRWNNCVSILSKMNNINYSGLLERNRFATPTVLVHKECFRKAGLFDESLVFAEDWDMWLRIARIYKIGYVDQELCKVYLNHSSITSTRLEMNLIDLGKVINRNKQFTMRLGEYISFRKSKGWLFLFSTRKINQSRFNTLGYAMLSIYMWPFLAMRQYIVILKTIFFKDGINHK